MKAQRMAALLLMLGIVVVLSIGVGATVNSADAESPAPKSVDGLAVAVPTPQEIKGTGVGTGWASFLGGAGAKARSELGASTAGLANWEANAKAACPNGYIVLSTPAPTDSFDPPVYDWGFGWVSYTTTYHVSIWIECDPPPTTSTPPPPSYPGWKPAEPYMKTKRPVVTAAMDAEYKRAVAAKYEELKQIKTPEQLIRLVESNKEHGADYSPFERAKRDGKITKVTLPSLEELLTVQVDGKPENR